MTSQRLLPILMLAICGAAHAQTRYVSDELVITLRTGPSTQNAIIRNLVSGDTVDVLEELPDEGYTRVTASDGTEGWVLTRYLQDGPTGDQQFAVADRELSQARERIAELDAQVAELSAALEATRGELGDALASGRSLSAELDDVRTASSSALELREQNESLRRRVTELTAEVDLVTMENSELSSRNSQNWFIVGAAVLFGGIVIGLVAPSLRTRRRSSW